MHPAYNIKIPIINQSIIQPKSHCRLFNTLDDYDYFYDDFYDDEKYVQAVYDTFFLISTNTVYTLAALLTSQQVFDDDDADDDDDDDDDDICI